MPDFFDRHSILARVMLVWIMGLITHVVLVACGHPTDLAGSFATFAGVVVGLPPAIIAYLQWSRDRAG